tara:strand:+ start:369128 stop:370483 length:1356 start_codon:yes stop_codon:yes gene_type:complete
MKKAILILAALFILALTAAGIWTYTAYFYTKPLTQQELTDLTPDWTKATQGNWSPWYIDPTDPSATKEWNPTASFNAWIESIPKEDKAWPALIDIHYTHLEHLKNEFFGLTTNDEDWDQTVAFLEDPITKKIISQTQNALRKPFMGCGLYNGSWTYRAGTPHPSALETRDPDEYAAMLNHGIENVKLVGNGVPNLDLFSTGQPYLGRLRSVANLLNSQAHLELQTGNIVRFIELLESISSSTKFCQEYPTHFDELVARAIESQVNRTIQFALVQQTPLTDDQLIKLDHLLARHQHRNPIWEAEQLIFRDTVRRLVNSKGQIIRQDYTNQLNDLFSQQFNGTHSELAPDAQRLMLVYDTTHNLIINTTCTGDKQAQEQLEIRIDTNTPLLSRRAALLLAHRESSMALVFSDFQKHVDDSEGLRLRIAMMRHTLRHGTPPQSKSSIDFDLLPS